MHTLNRLLEVGEERAPPWRLNIELSGVRNAKHVTNGGICSLRTPDRGGFSLAVFEPTAILHGESPWQPGCYDGAWTGCHE